jgi:hypothetical protein
MRTLSEDPAYETLDELHTVGSRQLGGEDHDDPSVLPEGARSLMAFRAGSYFDGGTRGPSGPAALHAVIMTWGCCVVKRLRENSRKIQEEFAEPTTSHPWRPVEDQPMIKFRGAGLGPTG